MNDSRKTLESIPVPASGATPDPLTTTEPATDGSSTGGIPRTADSALGESIGITGDTPAIGPDASAGSGGTSASGGSGSGSAAPGQPGGSGNLPPSRDPSARPPGASGQPQDDGPLDSLGKAIIAPVTGSEHEAPPRR